MLSGWAGTILDVNLSSGTVIRRKSHPYMRKYIGGRILNARLAWEHIPRRTMPFDEKNVIIISTGPLAGTLSPTSGRLVMSMISPVPYPFPWYTHSTMGGWFSGQMKYAGYDAIMIHGISKKKVYLQIIDDNVEIKNAEDIWGKDTIETQQILKARVDIEAQVMTIGPAGENRVYVSTVHHDLDNAAGHSGFGAVWGSKKLKAVIIRGTGGVEVAHPDKLIREFERLGKFRINPAWKCIAYRKGKDSDVSKLKDVKPVCSQSCTNNCHVGMYRQISDNRKINTFCLGRAYDLMQTEYRQAGTDIAVPAVNAFGPESATMLYDTCNRLGIDTWSRITFQSFLTALKEEGIDEIEGHSIEPDSGDWFQGFIEDLAWKRGLGRLFSHGLARTLDTLENQMPERLIRLGREIVFGFGFQAHREGRFWDREPLPYWIFSAMMYISETRDPTIGAHSLMHMAELQIAEKDIALKKFRKLSIQVWKDPDALEPDFNFTKKARVAVWCQRQHFINDSLPMCDFAFPSLMKFYNDKDEWLADNDIRGDLEMGRRLLNAVTGEHFTSEELDRAADRAMSIERAFLALSGRSRKDEERLASHFRLPCRDDGTYITEKDFPSLMDAYFDARGWDKKDGWPKKDGLVQLGLEDVAEALDAFRKS